MSIHPILPAPITDRPTSLFYRRIATAILAALIAPLLLSLAACSHEPETQAAAPETGQAVRVAVVREDRSPPRQRIPGVSRAVERAELAFLHEGLLAERLVRRGEAVSAGQALAILHNPALMPGVSAAEARVRELDEQLQRLERETRRLSDLHERGLIATDELDRVSAQRNAAQQARGQAQANLEEARDQLAEATLRAPFSGRVVALPVEPGQFVGPGRTIVSIAAPERLEVAVDLSPRQAQSVSVGDPVTVRRVEGGPTVDGTFREIGLPAPRLTARAVIDVPDAAWPEWLPGQAVHVELSTPASGDTLSVPLDALIDTGDGLPHVFRVRNAQAELLSVIPGELDGGQVRIDGDLEAGDEVVVAGHGQLLDGERVRVLR